MSFCSFGGYARWSRLWWRDLFRYSVSGWAQDVRSYWLRARYGWAPRDTWSLDQYVASVLGGSLAHLAAHDQGSPVGYDYHQWQDDLYRWAHAFERYATNDLDELHGHKDGYDDWHADEKQRHENMTKALEEMTPWFAALWD